MAILLCLGAIEGSACAQTFDATRWTDGQIAIDTTWRFLLGDDPQWASPSLDDSLWEQISLRKSWAEQGHAGYSGFAWYRIQLKLPAADQMLALNVAPIANAEEIYANGQLIGTIGQMRPKPAWQYVTTNNIFPLPQSMYGQTITVAIRVWQSEYHARYYGTGRAPDPMLGTLATWSQAKRMETASELVHYAPRWLLGTLGAAVGLFALGLYLLHRKSTEYLWACLYLLGGALLDFAHRYADIHWWATEEVREQLWSTLLAVVDIAQLLFIWSFVRAKADRLLYVAIALECLLPLHIWAVVHGQLSFSHSLALSSAEDAIIGLLVFVRLVQLAVRNNRDAQLLLIPFVLGNLVIAVDEIHSALFVGGFTISSRAIELYHGPLMVITWRDLSSLLSFLAIAAVLVLRFTHSAKQEQRLSAELDAAQQVQQVLLPESTDAVAGFTMESAYLPAQQVGGDFFQVVPIHEGGLLLVLGDVAGKGLPAAMLVSVMVGAIRATAEYTQEPAEILASLNERLVGRTGGGFSTALAAHITANGRVIIANAGHLSPYLNGKEIELPGALPLGILSGASYETIQFDLFPGSRMTFYSDGVIEAQNAKGELFGFERGQRISTQPAAAIVEAAKHFGQSDDITVVAITRDLNPANEAVV